MKIRITCFIALLSYTVLINAQTVNFTSSNLPIIVINTNGQEIPDDPKITADMGIILNANNARNNLSDIYNHYNGKIGIEVRGHSSQMFPMKSYGIELRDGTGKSVDKSLFGLPKESDWVLYAPYTDKTLMRNYLAYTMANEMGRWASHCRFVEVVVNGDYKGVYIFEERIKRGAGRVNIAKIATTDISGDAVTGGYIFSLDKDATGWFSSYPAPNAPSFRSQFSYVYPKPENIVAQQKDYLKSYIDSFENSLASPAYQDIVNGVRKFADVSSFIDYFIVNEISRNVDGYRLSSYFYKDRNSINSKIYAGPVWDYDLAFRNANYCSGSNIDGWAYRFNDVCPTDPAAVVPFWWEKLMTDTAFKNNLRCRWVQLRNSSLSNSRINFLIDSAVNVLSEASIRHFQRWDILGKYVWPNPQPIAATYAEEIEYLKQWLHGRVNWMDYNLPNSGVCKLKAIPDEDDTKAFTAAFTPNPFMSEGRLIINSRYRQDMQIVITDMTGHVFDYKMIYAIKGINYISDFKKLAVQPTGIYMVTVLVKGSTKQVIKIMHKG